MNKYGKHQMVMIATIKPLLSIKHNNYYDPSFKKKKLNEKKSTKLKDIEGFGTFYCAIRSKPSNVPTAVSRTK